MSRLTELEKQQLKFDWRYKGVSVLNLLTEEEVDKYSAELERIRRERQEREDLESIFRQRIPKKSTAIHLLPEDESIPIRRRLRKTPKKMD